MNNYNKKITTDNRYIIDSDSYWREELHTRIEYLPNLITNINNMIIEKLTNNIWGFPVDEQSISNASNVLFNISVDYFKFVAGRRVWVYTEVNGYWTEERISQTIAYAFIIALWDISKQLLINYYPLVSDDLRLRSGKTHSNDERETSHNNINNIGTNSQQYTQNDNTRNKIMSENNSVGSDTSNSRSTNNITNIQDSFLSPQDQGIKPSKQSENIMNRVNEFQTPNNMGVEEVIPNGNPNFTTATTNNFEGVTSTSQEGTTTTNRDNHTRIDEKDYIESNETINSNINAENNIGAKAKNDSGIERTETLDMSNVLKNFFDLYKERLIIEIDNRMLPYYLNMGIARYKNHKIDRKNYI